MNSELLDRYSEALNKKNIPEIQAIVYELNMLQPGEKKNLIDFYKKIGEDLFDESSAINNYDLAAFVNSASQSGKKRGIAKERIKIEDNRSQDNFDEVLLDFLGKCHQGCRFLKAHFLFQLDNDSIGKTQILILTDKAFATNPLIQRIIEQLANSDLKKMNLSDFISECKKQTELTNQKYLCLFAIPTNIVYDPDLQENIVALFDMFLKSSVIILKKDSEFSLGDYSLEKINTETFKRIENICGKVFNNRDITYQEEVIIKKCFPSSVPIIDYKILKSGFSGSKVIEVQPIKAMSGKTGRFVIKYSKKNIERKISKEHIAFAEFIEDFNIPGYSAKYIETELYEALKYNYASSDTRSDSFSFAKLLDERVKGKPLEYDLTQVLHQLFNCDPFKFWEPKLLVEKASEAFYVDYYNEHKIIESICNINACSNQDVLNSELWKNLQLIKSYKIKTYEKVCHGDLHTENFFKDAVDVFLIDFGYTANRHAMIDHTTLEASIKFKHLPIYIEIEELVSIENQLLDPASFQPQFSIISKRPVVKEFFELILIIRQNAAGLLIDNNNPIDYYLSLFFITLRQILFADLNQRYALMSALSLSFKIVELINS